MAANLWETLGEYNDALVDYKRPMNYNQMRRLPKIKRLNQLVAKPKSGSVPVIVFIEQGIVPQKVENKIDVPTPGGLVNIAFATYEPSTYVAPKSLKVKVNNKPMQDSYVISDIGALAVKDLKEKVVGNLTSQIMRASAKYAAQNSWAISWVFWVRWPAMCLICQLNVPTCVAGVPCQVMPRLPA